LTFGNVKNNENNLKVKPALVYQEHQNISININLENMTDINKKPLALVRNPQIN
jgi:hypothetical protein